MTILCKIITLNLVHKRFMEAQQAKSKQVSSNNENPLLTEMAADLENRKRQLKPNAEQEEIQYDQGAPRYGEQPYVPPLLNDPQVDTPIPEPISISSKITTWSDTIRSYLRGSVKTRPLDENDIPDERISNQNTVGNETTDNQFSDDLKVSLEGYKKLNLEIKKSDQLRV